MGFMPDFLALRRGLREVAWERQQVAGEDGPLSEGCCPALHLPGAEMLASKVPVNDIFEHACCRSFLPRAEIGNSA